MLDFILFLSYLLVAIGVLAAVVLPVIQMIKVSQDPKKLQRTGISFGSILVLFLISYVAAGSNVSASLAKYGVSESASKFVGGVLILTYIVLFLVIIGMLVAELARAFRT